MAELAYRPVEHRHAAFPKNAGNRPGFKAACDSLAIEYAVANEMLAARARSGLTRGSGCIAHGHQQGHRVAVGIRRQTLISISSLQMYVQAVGCKVEVRLVPQR